MNYNQDPRNRRNGYSPMGEPEIKRTYTPEEAGHDNRFRKPVTRLSYNSRRRKRKKVNFGVIILVLVFVLVAAACTYLIISGAINGAEKNGKETTTDKENSLIVETLPVETDENGNKKDPNADLPYITLSLSEDEVHTGSLVLVNAYNEYLFPDDMENDIVKVTDYKNDYYGTSAYSTAVKLSKTVLDVFNVMTEDYYNETGFMWLQINSAYRSREDQEELYANYLRDYGEEYVLKYVANPGKSEHHTGLGVDLNVNRNGAISYVEDDAECEWFRENCQKYGFILRYPADKVHITGISFESWHYRYVGAPHAQIMEDMNLCLEEYIDYVKNYTYDTTCIGYSEETGVYEITAEEYYESSGIMIYYVPADGKMTDVQIPKNCDYTISGNNVDGFVITCTK